MHIRKQTALARSICRGVRKVGGEMVRENLKYRYTPTIGGKAQMKI